MTVPFEEIEDRPDVGPIYEGISRYKRHTSRETSKIDTINPTHKKNILLSFIILVVVFFIIVLIIAINFDQKLIQSSGSGYIFIILSLMLGIFTFRWSYYNYFNVKTIREKDIFFGIFVGILLIVIFWWLSVEFLEFGNFGLLLAVVGFIGSIYLSYTYNYSYEMFPVIITFLVGIWISFNVGEEQNSSKP